jgi:PAS domain S-box-containing protein
MLPHSSQIFAEIPGVFPHNEAEAHLAAIVESSNDAIIGKDLNGIIISWNRAAERIFGYSSEEVIGKPISILAAPSTMDELPLVLERIRRGERVEPYETERRTKDGRIITISLTVSPVRNSAGEIVGASKVARDITEQRRARDAQEAIERELMLLIEASGHLLSSPGSPDVLRTIIELAQRFVTADAYAVWRWQKETGAWRITSFSGLSEEYAKTEFVSTADAPNLPDTPLLFENARREPLLKRKRRLLRAEGIRSMLVIPLRIVGEPSGTVAFYWRAPHKFSPGEVRIGTALGNLAAAALGAAELYDAQIQSRARAEWLESRSELLAQAGAILSSSLDYNATLANVAKLAVPEFADWCSVDVIDERGELRRLAAEHTDPEKVPLAYEFQEKYPPREDDLVPTVLRTGEPVLMEEVPEQLILERARNPEHLRLMRELDLMSLIAVPMAVDGQTLGVITFVNTEPKRRYTAADLQLAEELARRAAVAISHARLFKESKRIQDELQRSNEELRRVNEDLNQFAYTASHDLQEPLRMVAVFSQMLQREYANKLDAKANQYINYTVQGARRMEMLVKDLLLYTQAASIDTEPALPVEANKVLDQALSNLRAGIEESGAVIDRRPLPAVRVHEVHLLQLFQNLIGNAIKYRNPDKPPHIEVSFEPAGGFYRFCVSDNGIGVPNVYRQHIFGVFKRLHSGDKYPGTGIGLAICQRIVERYGGRIWVESEQARGSCFYFTLPMQNETSADGKDRLPHQLIANS